MVMYNSGCVWTHIDMRLMLEYGHVQQWVCVDTYRHETTVRIWSCTMYNSEYVWTHIDMRLLLEYGHVQQWVCVDTYRHETTVRIWSCTTVGVCGHI